MLEVCTPGVVYSSYIIIQCLREYGLDGVSHPHVRENCTEGYLLRMLEVEEFEMLLPRMIPCLKKSIFFFL